MEKKIALIAHDKKKDDLVNFVKQNYLFLSKFKLIATGKTGILQLLNINQALWGEISKLELK